MRDLRAGRAVWHPVWTRHVVRVAFVDHKRARNTLVRLVAIRSAADHLGDLLVWVGGGKSLRHDRTHAGRGLSQRVRQQRERGLEAEQDGGVVGRTDLISGGHQRLAESVARAPPLDAGRTVTGEHLVTVMEHEIGAQRNAPGLSPVLGCSARGHLRLGTVVAVEAEQRVEHQEAVVTGLIGRGPDGVEHGQVGLRHELQHAGGRAAGDCRGRKRGCGGSQEGAAMHSVLRIIRSRCPNSHECQP